MSLDELRLDLESELLEPLLELFEEPLRELLEDADINFWFFF